MNKAFEKILERFKEKLKKSEEIYYRYLDDINLPCMFDKSDIEETRVDTIKEMLEIVQEVAEEYNGGWIPCSERLPEECTEVLVSVKEIDGSFYTRTSWVQDGVWVIKKTPLQPTVIAWQPLPEPYKEGN